MHGFRLRPTPENENTTDIPRGFPVVIPRDYLQVISLPKAGYFERNYQLYLTMSESTGDLNAGVPIGADALALPFGTADNASSMRAEGHSFFRVRVCNFFVSSGRIQ